MNFSLEEDREYFQKHSLDRLLEIASEWIHSARGMVDMDAIHGVSGSQSMIERAQRILTLALERNRK
jgi:hypothetical protein